MGIIHERVRAIIDRYGPQAVVPFNYAGPQGMLAGDSMSLRFFHKLGATQLKRNPLCGGIRTEAYAGTFGECPGTPLQQVSLAQLIIVWGNNATVCNLHLMRQINAAKHNGAKLVVVDPRRIKVAEQAHLHLAVRPGTDVVLAWSLATELERTGGLDRAFIEQRVLGFEAFMAEARAYPPERAAEIAACPPMTSAPWRAGIARRRRRPSPGGTDWSATRTAAPAWRHRGAPGPGRQVWCPRGRTGRLGRRRLSDRLR